MRIKITKAPYSKKSGYVKMTPYTRDFGDYVFFILGYEIAIWIKK